MTRSFGTTVAVGVMAVGLLTAACGAPRTSNTSSDTPLTATSSAATGTTTSGTPTTSDSSASQAPGASGATAAHSQCLTGNLKVTAGTGDAGAGHSFIPIVFTNVGTAACTIAAYPGVSFVTGDDGQQVGDPATRVPASMPAITLAPGQSASAALSITNVGMYDASQCKPVEVRGLRVYPPNNTAAAFVPLNNGVRGCSAHVPNQTPLSVKPVVPGVNAQ
jgi:hypothetical protein